MCAILYFFLMVCNKPHANLTIIYENIKEIHILAVGGNLEFPILSHVLLHRVDRIIWFLSQELSGQRLKRKKTTTSELCRYNHVWKTGQFLYYFRFTRGNVCNCAEFEKYVALASCRLSMRGQYSRKNNPPQFHLNRIQ